MTVAPMTYRQRGFSIIELVVVLTILGVLASLALPLAEMSVKRAKEQALMASLGQIRDAIDAYKRAVDAGWIEVPPDTSGYPPNLQVLVQGVPHRKTGERLYFLRRVPRDPFGTGAHGETTE